MYFRDKGITGTQKKSSQVVLLTGKTDSKRTYSHGCEVFERKKVTDDYDIEDMELRLALLQV
jgi:hypothetical protein